MKFIKFAIIRIITIIIIMISRLSTLLFMIMIFICNNNPSVFLIGQFMLAIQFHMITIMYSLL